MISGLIKVWLVVAEFRLESLPTVISNVTAIEVEKECMRLTRLNGNNNSPTARFSRFLTPSFGVRRITQWQRDWRTFLRVTETQRGRKQREGGKQSQEEEGYWRSADEFNHLTQLWPPPLLPHQSQIQQDTAKSTIVTVTGESCRNWNIIMIDRNNTNYDLVVFVIFLVVTTTHCLDILYYIYVL